MPNSPKDNLLRIQRILTAWQTLAPNKSFGGMTLAQFQAAVQPSLDKRQQIDSLEEEIRQAQADRDAADEVSLVKAQRSSTACWQTRPKAPTARSTKASATQPSVTAAAD